MSSVPAAASSSTSGAAANIGSNSFLMDNQRLLTLRVAFQGELGAYSQKAVYAFFGKSNVKQVVPLPTLQRVFGMLTETTFDGKLDFAVVPIENSLAGTVGETEDLLISNDVRIVGETSVPIEHCIVINPDSSIDRIRKVMSHPQALAQCREYLDKEGRSWEQISVYDTAGSVKMVKEQNLMDTAGIASELAAEIYGMKIGAKGIEDDHSNTTRFIVIRKNVEEDLVATTSSSASPLFGDDPSGNDKTSAIFVTKHEPGALVRALSALSSRGINLGKIESRPIRGKPWEYYFFVDFDGHVKEDRCKKAIADLAYQSEELKILGSYKKGI